jgi:hypothetical protein
VGARIAPPKLRRHGPLRLAVVKREQQRDRDCVSLDGRQRVEVERDELAVGPHTSADAEATLEGDDRRRMLDARAVEVRARLAPQVQDVLEALVGDERRPRAAALEQGVRRDRRPVREAFDLLGSDRRRGRDHRLLLMRRRRHLRDPNVSVRHQHGVRERASDVDSERSPVCKLGIRRAYSGRGRTPEAGQRSCP